MSSSEEQQLNQDLVADTVTDMSIPVTQDPSSSSVTAVSADTPNLIAFPGSFPTNQEEQMGSASNDESIIEEEDEAEVERSNDDKNLEKRASRGRQAISATTRFLSPDRLKRSLTLSPGRVISNLPQKSKGLLKFHSSGHKRTLSSDSIDSTFSSHEVESDPSLSGDNKSSIVHAALSPSSSSTWVTKDGTSIEGIAKSFVGLLTATSMYAGYEDLDEESNAEDGEDDEEEEVDSHKFGGNVQDPLEFAAGEASDSELNDDNNDDGEEEDDVDDDDEEEEEENPLSFDATDFAKSINSFDDHDNRTLRTTTIGNDEIYNLSNDTSITFKDPTTGASIRSSTIPLPNISDHSLDKKTKNSSTSASSSTIQRRKSKFELSVEQAFCQSGSNASLKRATGLYKKLNKVFDISGDDQLIADYSCWLMGDVLLQGQLYITHQCILFFAFLPKRQGSIIKSGAMSTKSYPSLREHRKWAILRDNSLTIYSSPTDLYFPQKVIDLRTAIRAETIYDSNSTTANPNKPVWIRIITETQTHSFLLDSLDAARSWVTTLKKHIFAVKAVDDQVAVKIPLTNIMDLELTSVMGEAKNLRVKVLEDPESFAVDDYFLMFFVKGDEAIATIKKSLDTAGIDLSTSSLLLDPNNSMKVNRDLAKASADKNTYEPTASAYSRLSKVSVYKPSLDKLKSKVLASHNYIANVYKKKPDTAEEYTERDHEEPAMEISVRSDSSISSSSEISIPDADASQMESQQGSSDSSKSYWGASLVKNLVTSTTAAVSNTLFPSNHYISHYYERNSLERGDEDSYLVKDVKQRQKETDRFVKLFSLPSNEKLVATYNAYLLKSFPIYGKIYLGTNEICFRSTTPGISTIMILPFTDIENINKEKGFRFGYQGLVIVIHGHEESFFEFSFAETRDDCEVLLLRQMDIFKKSSIDASITQSSDSVSSEEGFKLAESSNSLGNARIKLFESRLTDHIGADVPIILKDNPFSKSSIKPARSYKFVLLTIGSRGDVQPYIALGKALLKEGHQVKIVSHKEFGDWVASYNIEFKAIAGEPSALMNLMVTHPNFNYTFIKEARKKFKTWIDDLLTTAWQCCSDAEILIESPSTMCGIHIAEKLQIPYFRAFTMPWTRTRAYPHAFMVPDQKLGGAYNYMTHVAFENAFWKGISHQVNKWRVETLGLPKTNLGLMKQTSVPFLYNISPTVFPPSVDFAEWIKVTGYWFLDEENSFTPPKALLDFMDQAKKDDKKLVYIGFGSIVVSNPTELTKSIVDAVLEADVRCILNKGWSDRLGGDKTVKNMLPPEVYNAGTVPHDWLFPLIDAAVHHGGSGTTGASLRFGLPTIVKPFFGDQKFYAARVEDLGCGVALKDLNHKTMASALKKVTTNTRIIAKAKMIGQKIRSENGVQTAIEAIYGELEYAKKLAYSKAHPQAADLAKASSDEEMDESWLLL